MSSPIERLAPKGRVRFDIRRDRAELAQAAAHEAAQVLREAVAIAGSATLIATGGATPGPVYDRLSQADLPWDRVTVTLSDERWVDAGSEDSNERLVRARLLRGPATAARFLPLKGNGASPEEDAQAACDRLAALAGPVDIDHRKRHRRHDANPEPVSSTPRT